MSEQSQQDQRKTVTISKQNSQSNSNDNKNSNKAVSTSNKRPPSMPNSQPPSPPPSPVTPTPTPTPTPTIDQFPQSCHQALTAKLTTLPTLQSSKQQILSTQLDAYLQTLSKTLIQFENTLIQHLRTRIRDILEYETERLKEQVQLLNGVLDGVVREWRVSVERMVEVLDGDRAGSGCLKLLGRIASRKVELEWREYERRIEGIRVEECGIGFRGEDIEEVMDDVIDVLKYGYAEKGEQDSEGERGLQNNRHINDKIIKIEDKQIDKSINNTVQIEHPQTKTQTLINPQSRSQTLTNNATHTKIESLLPLNSQNLISKKMVRSTNLYHNTFHQNMANFDNQHNDQFGIGFSQANYSGRISRIQNFSSLSLRRRERSAVVGERGKLGEQKEIMGNQSAVSIKIPEIQEKIKIAEIQENLGNDIGTIVVDQYKQTKTIKKLKKIQQKYKQKQKSPEKDLQKIAKLILQKKKLLKQLE